MRELTRDIDRVWNSESGDEQLGMPLSAARPRVLLIEDEVVLRRLIASHLSREGYDVEELGSGYDFADYVAGMMLHATMGPNVIVTDVRMPGYGGLQILDALRDAGWTTPVIVMTAYPNRKTVDLAMAKNAVTVLAKPFGMDRLSACIESVAFSGSTRKEDRRKAS